MVRGKKGELDELKRVVDLVQLVRDSGVELKGTGDRMVGLCPFHEDTKPSLVVTPSKKLWKCFGACQTGGSAIDWIMKRHGISCRHAIELLKNDYQPTQHGPIGDTPPPKTGTTRPLPTPLDESTDDENLLVQVIDYYHQCLKDSPQALEYLTKRQLTDPQVIDTFRLGYANRSLGLRMPERNRKLGKELRDRLSSVGILRKSGHEHFNGCLVVPIFDASGKVVEVYGRKINDNLREGTAYHLYLPGPHRGILNPDCFKHREIILCESIIDALTFWCHGYHNVTTAYGIEGMTEELFTALTGPSVERIFIAYDRDEAGENAARKIADRFLNSGIDCFRVTFPAGMDANEVVRDAADPSLLLGQLLRTATWLGKGTKKVGPIAVKEKRETAAPDEVTSIDDTDTAHSPFSRQEIAGNGNNNSQSINSTDEVQADSSAAGPHRQKEKIKTAAKEEKEDGSKSDTTDIIPPNVVGADVPVEIQADRVIISFPDRIWQAMGLAKKSGVMRLTMKVTSGNVFHIDQFDLYNARARGTFISTVSGLFDCSESDLRRELSTIIIKLEEIIEDQAGKSSPQKKQQRPMKETERQEALSLLRDPKLIDRICEDFEQCGLVGERTNILTGYLACVSRLLDRPLGIIIQSSSAAGKTTLMDALLSFMPRECWKKYSSMTGQSLFYIGETDLKNRVLALVEDEGVSQASYPLKLLQSEGELTIASTGKDPNSGKMTTNLYRMEGPVVLLLTTTNEELDEELLNRCLLLTVNESREQTRAIHHLQRFLQTLEGQRLKSEWDHIQMVHHNAQRLLQPLSVVNPFAMDLTFLDERTRTRRDHMKYLSLIQAITLLHQYQRPIKVYNHRGNRIRYVEVSLDDIALANRLANEVLGRSLDELLPQSRRFLTLLTEGVASLSQKRNVNRSDLRFTRREACEMTGWSYDQVRVHLERLIEREYVLIHRGSRGQQFVYELLYDGSGVDGEPFVVGLLDVEQLRLQNKTNDTTTTKSLGSKNGGFGVPLGCPLTPIGESEKTSEPTSVKV